jgi:hypothetical protein
VQGCYGVPGTPPRLPRKRPPEPKGRSAGWRSKYPLAGTLFPPEILAPLFRWKDARAENDSWQITIRTSQDEVAAPLFFREVTLPFGDAVRDPSRIRWRFGPISSPGQPPVVLQKLPVCGNCHSFTADGKTMGMDIDSANDKGSYAIAPVTKEIVFDPSEIITWSDYKREDGERTFGLLAQINSNDKPTILRNETVTGNHWIQLRLRGVKTNRDGVGARVYVVAGDLKQMDEVHSGRGYQSHWGSRLHFGLAKNKRIERIEVHWPRSGIVDILEDVAADQFLTIAEGSAPSPRKPMFVYPRLPRPPAGK